MGAPVPHHQCCCQGFCLRSSSASGLSPSISLANLRCPQGVSECLCWGRSGSWRLRRGTWDWAAAWPGVMGGPGSWGAAGSELLHASRSSAGGYDWAMYWPVCPWWCPYILCGTLGIGGTSECCCPSLGCFGGFAPQNTQMPTPLCTGESGDTAACGGASFRMLVCHTGPSFLPSELSSRGCNVCVGQPCPVRDTGWGETGCMWGHASLVPAPQRGGWSRAGSSSGAKPWGFGLGRDAGGMRSGTGDCARFCHGAQGMRGSAMARTPRC